MAGTARKERVTVPRRVITANRLIDGAVVWRDATGCWCADVDRAAASDDDDAVALMLAGARSEETEGVVMGPYEVEVEVEQTAVSRRVLPIRLRERIRAGGPTVAPN
jgi:hypothetical protein